MATLKLRRIKPKLITIKSAAKQLGLTEQLLRLALQQGQIKLGIAVSGPNGRYTYKIYQHMVDRFLEGHDRGGE